jgi:hypothetical protein
MRYGYAQSAMANTNSNFVGKKFSCPGCQSKLKFTRTPKSVLQKCPNCRRRLRLQERQAAADQDELLKEAIESLIDWDAPEPKLYNYRMDPALDQCDSSDSAIWTFDQPWPKNTGEIVLENTEVLLNKNDLSGPLRSREMMMNGKYKRVTAFRTGQVEEIEVSGHWFDVTPFEQKVGILPRSVVRQVNRIPDAKRFTARINNIRLSVEAGVSIYELFIDMAIDTTPVPKMSRRRV